MADTGGLSRRGRCLVFATFLLVLSLATVRTAAGAVIFVTTLQQKISSTGGCSLQEAIFASNTHSNQAIAGYDPSTHAPQVVTTQCAAGDGNDTIVLPIGGIFQLSKIVEDAANAMGPTATPMINNTNITILADGATLQHAGQLNFRLFAVGSTGHLTLRNATITNFLVHGGNGAGGGGGGMGAGGAIYVEGGGLTVENSTFQGNGAVGGNGAFGGDSSDGGGGGGIGGHGGSGALAGGGGGGALGDGGVGVVVGVGGGGTVFPAVGTAGGFACGGTGGGAGNGQDAPCPGGGGGGGGVLVLVSSGNGGNGNYGGGGGGAGGSGGAGGGGGNGGSGGFGGGGGASSDAPDSGSQGGNGGFGGGGGVGRNATSIGTNGRPGVGGMFGGDGNHANGGGGAGLGGAIFNDSGSVVVRNSTFTGNFVTRGVGGGAGAAGAADNGADAGGAIFTVNGRLAVLNATISGNGATGAGGGVVVVQTDPAIPTGFTLENTIIANNGLFECSVTGFVIAGTFAGNLIQNNEDCPGVVATGDPQLGPLQLNFGNTPTMAIPETSPAFNAADAATSLAGDQRGETRPQMGGFDIGAFELCLDRFGAPCIILAGVGGGGGGGTLPLTIQVSPAEGGTTSPAPGAYDEGSDSVVSLMALPNAGYVFTGWTGNVTDPTNVSTTVVIAQPQVVTATFALRGGQQALATAVLGGNILTKSGRPPARLWPVNVSNAGPAVALGVQISTFTLTQTFGAACTPHVLTPLPAAVGNLAPGDSATVNFTIDFTGCAGTARFTVQATFTANDGAGTGSMTRTNQFQ